MSKQNKWKMNRAGLLNFWYYDDEIFDFADGKLLLRGSNGSGKSVTMQSILPVLLDGKKSPDRLDPFGSRARKIEDYLLGEKEIVDRDERTGYLFIEYKRENTDQYITTGIGLQARRNKTLNAWYFIITDNRRIGKDLFLYEYEHHAGEKQQIPLSRIQLENRIGTGGQVVRTQGDYMKLINKYIFGFETIEAYEDLIKLLIQLRSPKLSKDFRPTVIYEILEAALPPLTDEDLRHLSDTIEHMDQTKQQIEQLEREQEALDKLIKRYHAYNEYKLVDTASNYMEAKKRFTKEEKITSDKMNEKHELGLELERLTKRRQELEQQADLLEKKQLRLRQHKVWSLEEERTAEKERLTETNQEYTKKDKAVREKVNQEFQTKERIEHLLENISSIEKEMNDQLIDLEADADEASFERHPLNVQDFERYKEDDFDFTVWKKEAENHYEQLESISEQFRVYEQTKKEIAETEKVIADTQLDIDQMKQDEKDWEQVFEKDKQDKINEIHAWVENHSFFNINADMLQQTSRDLLRLYEPTSFEAIRTPFSHVSQNYQLRVNETIATKNAEVTAIQQEIREQESELAEWKKERDPEPPNQQTETKEARQRLQAANHPYIPFYEAVEFQEHVDDDVRKRIEAALIDAGLLDALITNGDIPIEHDRVINPNPQMMAHTLADYLFPDVDENTKVKASRIDDVLRSILVESDENEAATIRIDGTYNIGLVEGHAVSIENVRYIGKNARKRYREEQIQIITAEIERLNAEKQNILREIHALDEKVHAAQTAMELFPNDDDLQESFEQIKKCRFQITQLEEQLYRYDEKMRTILDVFQAKKRKLDAETRGLNITFTHEAYQDAIRIQRRYEKELSDLEKLHVTYRHEQKNKDQAEQRLAELESEVDELKGEVNLLEDKKIRLEQNIAEIERQLQAHGMEDIRKQIQDVQREIAETNSELDTNRNVLPKKEAHLETVENVILEQQQKLSFSKVIIEAWKKLYDQEVDYAFIALPDDHENDNLEKWIIKKYKHQLQEQAKIEEQLTKVFYEQQPNLMEYRMTDHQTPIPDLEDLTGNWTDEQNILLENWKNKATRRIIQLDFQGKRLSPYFVQEMVEEDRSRQQNMLNEQDRQLYEEILFDSVGKKLRSRIHRAQQWTKKMNDLMVNSDSTSGISFSIQWKPRTAETEDELDTKELVDLLRRDPRLLKEEDLNQVMEHFRSKIARAKELIEIKGEGNTLLQVLKEVLDYRYWFSFVLSYQRVGEPKRELTNNAFYKFSGGEKAMAMYIPLFTACYSRYLEADSAAPYIISLDEAFAGVDDDNISVMFRIVEELGFDYIMNSQVLWGDYNTVSALSVCELVRPKNSSFVTVIRYLWDGKTRKLVVDELEKEESLMN